MGIGGTSSSSVGKIRGAANAGRRGLGGQKKESKLKESAVVGCEDDPQQEAYVTNERLRVHKSRENAGEGGKKIADRGGKDI